MKSNLSKEKEKFQEAIKAIGLILPEHHECVCNYIFEMERQLEQLYLTQSTLETDLKSYQATTDQLVHVVRNMQEAFRDAGIPRV